MKVGIEVVTGFLGAGKSAFINSLINKTKAVGEKIIVLTCESGNVKIKELEENDISVYGELHLCYLQEHRRLTYINLLTSGTLNKYLSEIDKQARERFCRIVKQFTEQMKAYSSMK